MIKVTILYIKQQDLEYLFISKKQKKKKTGCKNTNGKTHKPLTFQALKIRPTKITQHYFWLLRVNNLFHHNNFCYFQKQSKVLS